MWQHQVKAIERRLHAAGVQDAEIDTLLADLDRARIGEVWGMSQKLGDLIPTATDVDLSFVCWWNIVCEAVCRYGKDSLASNTRFLDMHKFFRGHFHLGRRCS